MERRHSGRESGGGPKRAKSQSCCWLGVRGRKVVVMMSCDKLLAMWTKLTNARGVGEQRASGMCVDGASAIWKLGSACDDGNSASRKLKFVKVNREAAGRRDTC